ncbi:YfcC family protein [Marinilongibacter aquaticus]|uniref:YfcC family protein n=1 Tax=Marinilongibacter aquaticus TaxID=2975157 RepID=UPI0021BDBE73|nr:YfcC family protein [Marinilongibacter aquaticus]UBM60874.1 YfcC family protein [Marinilongibacter aquaticus]
MKFPKAHTVLLLITAVVALLTWFVPAGQFDRLAYDHEAELFKVSGSQSVDLAATQQTLDSLGVKIPLASFEDGSLWKPVGIPGTYHRTAAKPQGVLAFLQAPLQGLTQSIDIILFVLILGGAIGVVHATGAFDAGVVVLARMLKGKEYWLIVLITFLMALGGTTFGLAEETIAFYPILVPVFLAAGYDAMVAVASIYLGSSIGTLASTVNPFSVIIGSEAAGINWTLGLDGRIVVFLVGLSICVIYIVRYAKRVKQQPTYSLVYSQREEIKGLFFKEENAVNSQMNFSQKSVLMIFAICFAVMIYGVSRLEWWFLEMTTVFFAGSLLIGFVARLKESRFLTAFIEGAQDLLSVALIIGIARGVTVLMEEGQIADTLLYYSSTAVSGMSKPLFITLLHLIYMGLSLFVPSSSGMAVLTMPIFAPLADVMGMGRELIVNAYIYGQGLMAFINPTGLVLASLTMVNVGFNKWLKFVIPLVLILYCTLVIALILGVYL